MFECLKSLTAFLHSILLTCNNMNMCDYIKVIFVLHSCTDSGYFETVDELERNVHIMKFKNCINDCAIQNQIDTFFKTFKKNESNPISDFIGVA